LIFRLLPAANAELARAANYFELEEMSVMLKNASRCDEANSGWASPEIEQAWMEEIERREQAYTNGEVELIPAEEVFRERRKIVAE